MTDLPNDLLAFLRVSRQLNYDSQKSEIGRITLKSDVDLSTSTITTFPNCQSIIEDPYSDLDGLYQIDRLRSCCRNCSITTPKGYFVGSSPSSDSAALIRNMVMFSHSPM